MNEESRTRKDCWRSGGVSGDSSCPKLAEFVHCRNCPDYNKAGRQLFDREIPEEFLDEWTRSYGRAKEADTGETRSVTIFRLRSEWFALMTSCLQETASMRSVHDVPGRTNSVFKGIVNINGELLLCMSAADVLECERGEGPSAVENKAYTRMLVFTLEGERFVLPVDEVLGIYRVPLQEVNDPPVTLSKAPDSLVKGVFGFMERKIGLLDEYEFRRALERSLIA